MLAGRHRSILSTSIHPLPHADCLPQYACVTMPISLCLSQYACLNMPISMCLSHHACLTLPIFLCLSHSACLTMPISTCLSQYVSICLNMPISLCLSQYAYLTLPVSLLPPPLLPSALILNVLSDVCRHQGLTQTPLAWSTTNLIKGVLNYAEEKSKANGVLLMPP